MCLPWPCLGFCFHSHFINMTWLQLRFYDGYLEENSPEFSSLRFCGRRRSCRFYSVPEKPSPSSSSFDDHDECVKTYHKVIRVDFRPLKQCQQEQMTTALIKEAACCTGPPSVERPTDWTTFQTALEAVEESTNCHKPLWWEILGMCVCCTTAFRPIMIAPHPLSSYERKKIIMK